MWHSFDKQTWRGWGQVWQGVLRSCRSVELPRRRCNSVALNPLFTSQPISTRELMKRMQLSLSARCSEVEAMYKRWTLIVAFLSAMIMMCWSSRWKENFEKFLPEKVWGSSFPVWDLWGGRKLQEVDIEQNTSDLNHFWSKYVDISSILHSKLSTKISLKSMISIWWAESSRQKDIIELTFSEWRSWCQISWVAKLSKVILAPPTFPLSPLTERGTIFPIVSFEPFTLQFATAQ